ncbi:MAG: hypothetical protein ACRCST_07970 [Turicibacter sp.]
MILFITLFKYIGLVCLGIFLFGLVLSLRDRRLDKRYLVIGCLCSYGLFLIGSEVKPLINQEPQKTKMGQEVADTPGAFEDKKMTFIIE